MCGIAGILSLDGKTPSLDTIEKMSTLLSHRGPDGAGVWNDETTALGHRRLSIIDLSDNAAQPMISDDGQHIICFNGEIYNYRELAQKLASIGRPCRTNSDTEVILKLFIEFDIEALSMLRGMFSFAIWDKRKKELFIARDRVGIKPLYFLKNDKAFVFASEIKAVAASGFSQSKLNTSAIGQYFRFLVIPQPDTIFTDIKKLLPGQYIKINAKKEYTCSEYWKLESHLEVNAGKHRKDCINSLKDLLLDSVNYHMVADVPVSAFLSGGLDSSAVVSLMRELNPKSEILTFSTIFPGETEYDEGEYAKRVAELKNTEHYTNTIDENFIDDIKKISWHLDEPFAISSAYATYYLAKSAAQKTKVVLTGDGGDEIFAGYMGYLNNAYLAPPPLQSFLSGIYISLLSLLKHTRVPNSFYGRLLAALRSRIGSEGVRYSEQIAQNSTWAMGKALTSDFLLSSLSGWESNLVAQHYESIVGEDTLLKKQFAEYKTRLVDEMLMKVDRMTMAHSLEARVPLLDHKIIEFAFRTPSSEKLRYTNNKPISKYLLKKTMEEFLPKDIIYRKKQGFNIPTKLWFQSDLINKICEQLCDGILNREGVINREGIMQMKRQQQQGQFDYGNMFIALLALENWAQVYTDKVGQVRF